MGWDRHIYRTTDDLQELILGAVRLSSVLEIRVRAGVLEVRHRDGTEGQALNSIRLPSDDLLDKVRSEGTDWKILHRGDVRTALLEGVALLRREGVHATHLASGSVDRLLRVLKMYDSSEDPGMGKWLAGLELVEHPGLDAESYLLCGGHRAHGSVADITTIVRLEESVE